jgi:hypothetical protein
MIIPAIYNKFKLFGGDTWDLIMNWKDSNDVLINLSGWHARLRMYPDKFVDRNSPIVELTHAAGITLGDGSAPPNIFCTIADENTDFDDNPPGYLILELEDTSGRWERLLEGKLKYSKASILTP